jgi:hypothetical protein
MDTLEVVAGIGRRIWGAPEGNALTMSLTSPYSVFPADNGVLYITSVSDAVLWELQRHRLCLKLGGAGAGFVNGKLQSAKMEGPSGGCFDPKTGSILVVDGEDCRIRQISSNGLVTSIGTGASACVNGSFLICAFHEPSSICRGEWGSKRKFYVTELAKVRELDFSSETVTTFAGSDQTGFSDGPKLKAKFNRLEQIVSAQNGTFFVADYGNARIRRIAPDGQVSTLAGPLVSTSSDDHSKSGPFGLCLTPNGDLVFSQPKIRQIQMLKGVIDREHVVCIKESLMLPPNPSLTMIELKHFEHNNPPGVCPFPLHAGFVELCYPQLMTYSERIQQIILNANIPLEEFTDALLSESIPASWTAITAVNMHHLAKQCHLPVAFRETLIVKLEILLSATPYEDLWSLIHHVEAQLDNNQKLGRIIAYTILIQMSERELVELPPNMSSFALNCFEPALLESLKSGTKFGRPTTKLSDSHLRARLEWLYENMKASPSSKKSSKSSKTAKAEKADASPLPPSLACNFELESSDGHKLACHDWVLYARWPYFRALVASGSQEWILTRKIVFPSGTLSRKAVRALLEFIYTNRIENIVENHETALQLLTHAQRFQFIHLETPAVAYPGFETFFSATLSAFDKPCTLENCIDLYKLAKELGNDMYIFRVITFIAEHIRPILQHPKLAPQLLALGSDALASIWIWSNGGPKEIPS